MSGILDNLLNTCLKGEIIKVLIGLHWIAVVAEVEGERRCGLASTLQLDHHHHVEPDVPQAGRLELLSSSDLATLIRSDKLILSGIGLATTNALLPRLSDDWVDLNAEAVIATRGAGKNVALIGHFPFVPRLRPQVGQLSVLEHNPRPGDLPSAAAAKIVPQADVVAITGTTLINHTLDGLLDICSPQAVVILLGPSTPLSPVLFEYGVDILCGSVVTRIEPVLHTLRQGGNFRQVHRAGVRTVAMTRPGFKHIPFQSN